MSCPTRQPLISPLNAHHIAYCLAWVLIMVMSLIDQPSYSHLLLTYICCYQSNINQFLSSYSYSFYGSHLEPLIDLVDKRMRWFEQILKSIYQTSDHTFWLLISFLLMLRFLLCLPIKDLCDLFSIGVILRCAQLIVFVHYIVVLLTWYQPSKIVQSSTEVVISHRPHRSDYRRAVLSLIITMILVDIGVSLLINHVDHDSFMSCLSLIFITIQLDREPLIDHPYRRLLRFLFFNSRQPLCHYLGLSIFRGISTDRHRSTSDTPRFRYLNDLIQTITHDSLLQQRMLSLFDEDQDCICDRPIIRIVIDDLLSIAKSYEHSKTTYHLPNLYQDRKIGPIMLMNFFQQLLVKAYTRTTLPWFLPYSRTTLAVALNNAYGHTLYEEHSWHKLAQCLHSSHIQTHHSEPSLQNNDGDRCTAKRLDCKGAHSLFNQERIPRTRSVDQLPRVENSDIVAGQSASHAYSTNLLLQTQSHRQDQIVLALECLGQSFNLIQDCAHSDRHQGFIILCNYLSALITASRIECLPHTHNSLLDTNVQRLRQSQLISERDDLRFIALFTMGHYYQHEASSSIYQHRQTAYTYFRTCQTLLPKLVGHEWMTDDIASYLSESINQSVSCRSL